MIEKIKRILLVAPDFYGYEYRIAEAFEKEGMAVELVRIYKVSRINRYISKLYKKHIPRLLNKYYVNIIDNYSSLTIDYLLIIDGKGIPDNFISAFLNMHPETISIYYSWDSLQYFDYLPWLNIFDKVFTFDYKDAREYKIKYLPLFYTPELEQAGESKKENKYDLLFIASYKESRLNFINSIIDKYNTTLNIKVILYLSVFRYIIDRIKGKRLRRENVVFHPLPFEKYLELLSQTKAILDFTPSTQTGLPMRIPEAVGARKKIITNNQNVKEEFDDSHNILVYKQNIDICDFINSDIDEMIGRERYSISCWIKEILN